MLVDAGAGASDDWPKVDVLGWAGLEKGLSALGAKAAKPVLGLMTLLPPALPPNADPLAVAVPVSADEPKDPNIPPPGFELLLSVVLDPNERPPNPVSGVPSAIEASRVISGGLGAARVLPNAEPPALFPNELCPKADPLLLPKEPNPLPDCAENAFPLVPPNDDVLPPPNAPKPPVAAAGAPKADAGFEA